ncbi:class I SAM-dependent methyltransferase [Aggregatilinea lenta]|uniref:class I SAM-dependent methyltransferase n=1 Tax=Aggregatilinea lenta TaxID=913108 RepID=UPI000E5B8086|nr:class I SAM-dependent methyltransferase [Aggregatilinea lenta]
MFKRQVAAHQAESFSTREQAQHYAHEAGKSMLKYQAFLKELKALDVAGSYLDVGAGPGILTAAVAQQHPGVTITALELEPEMAAIGRETVAARGLAERIAYAVGSATDGEFVRGLGTFDLIYSSFTLHHFDDPGPVLCLLADALNEDGRLVLYDLRRAPWLYWVPSRSGFFQSLRAAYVTPEIDRIFAGVPLTLEKNAPTPPFLQTVIARQA